MVGFFKQLFGGGDAVPVSIASKSPDAIFEDVEIRADPIKEVGGQWRVAGTLTKIIDGETRTRRFVRADLVQSQEEAITASVNKGKMIVEQNGAYIWKGDENQPV